MEEGGQGLSSRVMLWGLNVGHNSIGDQAMESAAARVTWRVVGMLLRCVCILKILSKLSVSGWIVEGFVLF